MSSSSLPTLSHADATRIVGEPVFSVVPVSSGIRSRVYRVETEDGTVRMVRLTARGETRVERESAVRTLVARRGYPRGDLPLVAEVQVRSGPLAQQCDIVTMNALAGATMGAALRTLFAHEVPALFQQLGQLLARLHGVEGLGGVGPLTAQGSGLYAHASQWLAAWEAASLEQARVAAVPLGPRVTDLLAHARTVLAQDPNTSTVLVHGDLQPLNVQVFRGRIVALFDFEFACLADPILDTSYVRSWCERLLPSQINDVWNAFAAGYATVLPGARALERDSISFAWHRLIHALRGAERLSAVAITLPLPERSAHTHAVSQDISQAVEVLESLLRA